PVGSWGRSCGFSLPFPRDRSASHRAVHSFPTRRSSDLLWPQWRDAVLRLRPLRHAPVELPPALIAAVEHVRPRGDPVRVVDRDRSEEHTSELQSRENLVCRLLLEKKNPTGTPPSRRACP